jgi:hypothetical protein
MKVLVVISICFLASVACADLTPAISGMDLKHIRARVIKQHGWSSDFADRAVVEYRKFLFLHFKHPDTYLVPSLAVDEIWHAHILFTEKYAADSEAAFGTYFHHFPSVEDDNATAEAQSASDHSEAYDNLFVLYEQQFGMKPDLLVWGDPNITATATATAATTAIAPEADTGKIASGSCSTGKKRAPSCSCGSAKKIAPSGSCSTGKKIAPSGSCSTGKKIAPSGSCGTGKKIAPSGSCSSGKKIAPSGSCGTGKKIAPSGSCGTGKKIQ